ncbi:Rab-GAP TBC domain-containing protein [Aphelenchoides besseyi]|nr:Rab-GAP TBC domain-containing protein [Aphelenchoides besseyi]
MTKALTMCPTEIKHKETWYSMQGFLAIKQLSTALSFITSRKRMYFGLDEASNRLVYFKDKNDFDRRRDGYEISLDGAICIPTTNVRIFLLHTESKKYEIEADNAKCAECWIVALQRRKDLNDNPIGLPAVIYNSMKRYRSRSRSMPSDVEHSPTTPPKQKSSSTRRKGCRPDALKRLIIPTHAANMSCPVTPTTAVPVIFPENGHVSRLSRCISLNAGRVRQTPSNTDELCVVVDDPNKRRASLQITNTTHNYALDDQINADRHITLDKPPTWLEEWVQKWLNEQKLWTDKQKSEAFQSTDYPDRSSPPLSSDIEVPHLTLKSASDVSAAETGSSDVELSATTSRADTDDHASIASSCSAPEVCEELLLLREIDNQQKARIHSLTIQLEKMKELLQARGKPIDESALLEQNRVLNTEVVRMSEQCLALDKQLQTWTKKCGQLENEIENVKKEYVYLLQSCVRIPLHDHFSCDTVQVKLFGGDIHEKRVKRLLTVARELDPKLPTFESVTTLGNFHVDDYGFRHNFDEVPLALHYICTQLNAHYYAQSEDYVKLKGKWRFVLETNSNRIENNRSNRQLCRAGIPRSMRSAVWRVLINQTTADLKQKYGEHYFRGLCTTQGTPNEKQANQRTQRNSKTTISFQFCATHQKQINLDLLRTMPTNVHFLSASCKGVNHLQTVLRAFCLHNPNIGYSQGMNFLAATALLFVSPEDTFWFLVGLTERYFDPSYYDENLTGAQADQEVLKEIVEMKYPKLAKHLEECDIDLTTVTLNWFIALFFDAVPFQTMLRIWDCFLLEGPKVLFRFSVALLGLYQDEILERTDTITVIKVIKAAVRLTYDVDGLIKYAFEELDPFPSRGALKQKQSGYLKILRDRLNQRRALRNILDVVPTSKSSSERICDLPIEAIVFSEFTPGVGYICAGNQLRGKIGMITCHSDATNLNLLDLEFDCRPVSMVVLKKDMAFVSLLSNYVVALHLGDDNASILWELKLSDVAIKLLYNDERLYCGLANGTLTILENANVSRPTALDLYNIPISAAPITDALMDDEFLYLAVACKVCILNKDSLSPIANIYVASSACGSHFEKIRALHNSPFGLFLVTAHSSLIQLWKEAECEMLYDISFDHSQSSRRLSVDEVDPFDGPEVYSILYFNEEVFVGTTDGYLMLYRITQIEEAIYRGTMSASQKPSRGSLDRYPAGKRISPIQTHSDDHSGLRQAMYYIPSHNERLLEEITSAREFSPDTRQTRKLSIMINPTTKEYKVQVQAVRQFSQESTNDSRTRRNSSSAADSNSSPVAKIERSTSQRSRQRPPLHSAQSIDSAFSQFSGDDHYSPRAIACEPIPETQPTSPIPHRPKHYTEKWAEKRRTHSDSVQLAETSGISTEYDDETFDLCHEADGQIEMQLAREIGLLEQSLGHNSPTLLNAARNAQIPVRRMSTVFGKSRRLTVDEEDEDIPEVSSRTHSVAASESSVDVANQRSNLNRSPIPRNETQRRSKLRLRRKDLEIENNATVLVAVKEPLNADSLPTPPTSSSASDSSTTTAPVGDRLTPADALGPLASAEERRDCWLSYTSARKPSLITNGVEEPLEEKTVRSSLSLSLQMKLKVSDRPLKCIALTQFNGEPVVITGAGDYGGEEALLRWRKDENSGLWINDPLVDSTVAGRRRTLLSGSTIKRGSTKRSTDS